MAARDRDVGEPDITVLASSLAQAAAYDLEGVFCPLDDKAASQRIRFFVVQV